MNALQTPVNELELVMPDVERDAPAAVSWLSGEVGKNTLLLMGNVESDIKPPTLEVEIQRIHEFINLGKEHKQLTWMIQYQEKTVGAVWVELEATEYLPYPAVHIMIGDPAARGHGIGENTFRTVIEYLQATENYEGIYSRSLSHNQHAKRLLSSVGFQEIGESYQDKDGLLWQNVHLKISN